MKVICQGDQKPGNNILIKSFGVYNPIGTRTLVVCEEFTGTWCAYCPGAAMGLSGLVENGSLVLHTVLTETDIPHFWINQDKVDFVERAMSQGPFGTPVDLSD